MMHESPPSGGEKLLHFDTAFMISPLLTELKSGATENKVGQNGTNFRVIDANIVGILLVLMPLGARRRTLER